jgi:hypothetical protein
MSSRSISRWRVGISGVLLFGLLYFSMPPRAYAPPPPPCQKCTCKLVYAWWDNTYSASIHILWIDPFGGTTNYPQAVGDWCQVLPNCDGKNAPVVDPNDSSDYPVYKYANPAEMCGNAVALARQDPPAPRQLEAVGFGTPVLDVGGKQVTMKRKICP